MDNTSPAQSSSGVTGEEHLSAAARSGAKGGGLKRVTITGGEDEDEDEGVHSRRGSYFGEPSNTSTSRARMSSVAPPLGSSSVSRRSQGNFGDPSSHEDHHGGGISKRRTSGGTGGGVKSAGVNAQAGAGGGGGNRSGNASNGRQPGSFSRSDSWHNPTLPTLGSTSKMSSGSGTANNPAGRSMQAFLAAGGKPGEWTTEWMHGHEHLTVKRYNSNTGRPAATSAGTSQGGGFPNVPPTGRNFVRELDAADPDANFFKMDTWNADDSDLDDELAGGGGSRGGTGGIPQTPGGPGSTLVKPSLRSHASSYAPYAPAVSSRFLGSSTSTHPDTQLEAGTSRYTGPLTSVGYVGNKGVGLEKDLILNGSGLVPKDALSEDSTERLEWQNMLASVLGGEILKGEKSRIGGERPTSETFKREQGLSLWWQIRAKLRGRSEEEERRRVEERRERTVDAILEEVERFTVVLPEQFQDPNSVKSLRKSLRVVPSRQQGEESAASAEAVEAATGKEDVAAPGPTQINALEEELGAEDYALEQLLGILNKLSLAESMYPHLNAMKAEKPLYGSEAFQAKVEAMHAWVTMVNGFRTLLERLQRWTGSKDLDIAKRNTNAEKALVGGSRYRPIDPDRHHAGDKADNVADDSTFIERLLKEDSITRTFNRRALTDLYRLIYSAKQTIIDYSDVFDRVLGLENFALGVQNDLALLVNFPTRLLVEAMRVRLDAARRLQDPSEAVIADMTEAFRRTMMLAVAAKTQYGQIMEQDAGKKWQLPPCIADGFDQTILDGLKAFFKLLHWTLKSGSKAIYFRETEVLENEWEFLYTVAESVEGGDVVVAEHFCSLTNKLMARVIEYFETQLRVPVRKDQGTKPDTPTYMESTTPRGDKEEFFSNTLHQSSKVRAQREMSTEEMISWFAKVLDAVKMRYRKLQRFARRLTQRFDNSAEYDIADVDLELIIESLDDTGHFMVHTQTFEQEGTYLLADTSLRERPDLIKQLLYKSFSSLPRGRRSHPRVQAHNDGAEMLVDDIPEVDGPGSSGGDASDAEHDVLDGSYLLILSPRRHFFWPGPVMSLDLPLVSLKMQDCRIRLIADGPVNRLQLCKETFLSSFVDQETGDAFLDLNCFTEQQAHLPRIQRELRRIARSTNRLSESIVASVAIVRTALKGGPGTQDLLQNWFTFATDHGQRVGVHMDHAAWSRFSRQLMRLSIAWIAFITDSCDPTDRKTFRWAVNALEYAMLMTRANNILHLDQSDFAMLRAKVASCMALLISHFDILGARSSIEAKKEAERLEAMRRLQRLQENMDDEYSLQSQEDSLTRNVTSQREKVKALMDAVYGSAKPDHSVRLIRDQRMVLLDQIEQARVGFISDQHMLGQVLDEEVSEDRSLLFLAVSSSNIAIKWQQGGFIGGGANGNVYIGFNLDSGGIMAVKEIRVQDLSNTPALYKQIKDESDVMQMLSHPNVVEYYGIEVHRDRVYIFEEYCEGGSLANLLEHGRIEDEEVVLMYTLQMLRGLDYLHSKGVEHRDVKPDNILLGVNSVIKFVDFGAAKVIAKGNRTLALAKSRAWATGGAGGKGGMMQAGGRDGVPAMNSLAGTPMYMAPEVIKNEKTGRLGAMDIWSLGCVILEFATGRKPWSNLDNEWAIMFHIGIATKHPPLPEPGQLSEIGIEFIESCLTLEPAQRPTAPELLEHPWVKDFIAQMGNADGPSLAQVSGSSGTKSSHGGSYRTGVNSLTAVGTASTSSGTTAVNSDPDTTRHSFEMQSGEVDDDGPAKKGGVQFVETQSIANDGDQAESAETIGMSVEVADDKATGPAEEEYIPFIDPETGLEMYTDETGRRYWLFDGEWHAEGEEEDGPAELAIPAEGQADASLEDSSAVTHRDFANLAEVGQAGSGVRFA